MKNHKVGIRYATALFDLVKEQNLVEEASRDMAFVYRVYNENRDFRLFLSSPVVGIPKKKEVLRAIFGTNVGKLILDFFQILTSKGREMHIGTIAEAYLELYKDFKGIKTATLTTAIVADDQIKNRVISLLQAHTGKKIELIEKVDPRLIGGFVLNFDDYQLDSSLNAQLNKLRKEYSDVPDNLFF
jgi:F-type H+-transporting ATPase subunit delta